MIGGPEPVVIGHADGTKTAVDDWYHYVYIDPGSQVGDWWWTEQHGHRALALVVPNPERRHGAERIIVYPSHEPKNWAAPGDVNGWDGNEESPTLSPSISIPGGWHGYFEQGKLRTA